MRRLLPFAIILTVFAIISGGIVSNMRDGMRETVPVPVGFVQAGSLDGHIYSASLGSGEDGEAIDDILVFKDGLFRSEECQRRCDYPAQPYFIRNDGGEMSFFSQAICTERDARIVWRGRIDDDRISGTFIWTSERWYWTMEREFAFEGLLIEQDLAEDSNLIGADDVDAVELVGSN